MNKKELKELKELLLAYRDKVSGDISSLAADNLNKSQKDSSGDLSGYTFHMADMATDHYDREFNLGLASTEQETLRQIDEALRKIDDKSYGVCEVCESDIPLQRLKVRPFALLCIKCQEEKEKNPRVD